MEEEDKVSILLKAQFTPCHHLVTSLKEKTPIPTLEDVINSIQEEEKKLGLTNTIPTHGAYMVMMSKKMCYKCGKTHHLTK